MRQSHFFKAIGLIVILFAFISCGGQKPMVDEVKVNSQIIDDDVWISLSAKLSMGNVLLPNAVIPILIPKDGREIGQVSLLGDASGANFLAIELNVTETARLDLAYARLPNGALIPLMQDRQVIVVPLGKGAQLYISIVNKEAILGVAVPIKTFDSMGQKIGTGVLMPVFASGGVIGSAGIFTSKTAGENGIALVADISAQVGQYLDTNLVPDQSMSVLMQAQLAEDPVDAEYSARQQKRIDQELYKLHRKSKRLSLH